MWLGPTASISLPDGSHIARIVGGKSIKPISYASKMRSMLNLSKLEVYLSARDDIDAATKQSLIWAASLDIKNALISERERLLARIPDARIFSEFNAYDDGWNAMREILLDAIENRSE